MRRTALSFARNHYLLGDGPVTTIYRRLTPVLIDLAGLAILAITELRRTLLRIRRAAAEHNAQPPMRLGRPVAHEGATETFGTELRALRHVEVSPELVSDIETELRWGLIWHEFERSMQAEIDRVFAPALEIAAPRDFDDLRALIGLRELTAA
jgi:hypothetical protein